MLWRGIGANVPKADNEEIKEVRYRSFPCRSVFPSTSFIVLIAVFGVSSAGWEEQSVTGILNTPSCQTPREVMFYPPQSSKFGHP